MAAAMTRTRLDRVRASVGIVSLALQQIPDDLTADDVDQVELAAILRERARTPTRPAAWSEYSGSWSPSPRGEPSRSSPTVTATPPVRCTRPPP